MRATSERNPNDWPSLLPTNDNQQVPVGTCWISTATGGNAVYSFWAKDRQVSALLFAASVALVPQSQTDRRRKKHNVNN